jgi:hypothetical protein
MRDFKIFTESKADVKFIRDYVSSHFNIQLSSDFFYELNSWAGYKSNGSILTQIQQNVDLGKEIILILDADNDFAQRQAEVLNDFEAYNIPANLFLFPNHSQAGNLENLLCEIATERKLMQCFEAYESCIKGYETPVIKSKVFAYLDALLPAINKKNNQHDLIQEPNRNYRNPAHWDLYHQYLQPLHRFLSPFFIQAN